MSRTMKRFSLLLLLFNAQCSPEMDDVTKILLVTGEPENVTLESASVLVTVESEQANEIIVRGICWGQSPDPEIDKATSKTENGAGAGSFTAEMTDLRLAKYYVRSYASTSDEIFYGNQVDLDMSTLIPSITITRKSSLGENSVELQASITYTHDASPITEQGVIWGLSPNLSLTNGTKIVDSGSGTEFSATLSPLSNWTKYYAVGYAVTSLGNFYSDAIDFVAIPPATFSSVNDIDGNEYKTVVINGREWMAENLKVTHYNNGSSIPAANQEQFKDISTGAYTTYQANPDNGDEYGLLYNGYAVSEDVCMQGWHIPTPQEWAQLAGNLGGFETAGGYMKSAEKWASPNIGAGNESGFSGIPGGSYCRVCLSNTGIFADLGTDGYWWSAVGGNFYYLTNNLTTLRTKGTAHVNDGLSVRCVKN
jgi:uncharacterized protein (TIGR02145 family)